VAAAPLPEALPSLLHRVTVAGNESPQGRGYGRPAEGDQASVAEPVRVRLASTQNGELRLPDADAAECAL